MCNPTENRETVTIKIVNEGLIIDNLAWVHDRAALYVVEQTGILPQTTLDLMEEFHDAIHEIANSLGIPDDWLHTK